MDTKKLRQKILDLAIHGKLVPQDPNDEPASVLLERIRAEKERLVKEGKIKKSKASKTSDTPHYENVPFEVPSSWVWTTVESICSKIGSGSTPKGSNYAPDGILFFRSQNVYNDGVVLDDIKYISEEVHQSMIRTEVLPNDLLLNITGGSLGRCAIVPNDIDRGNVSQHVCILRPIIVKTEYLHIFILSSFFAKNMKITGSGREGLPKYNLEKMLLPLPPLEEQTRIIHELNKWNDWVIAIEDNQQDLVETIKQTKSKILDLAIHGKLVPQDPNDEPASELLKRINPAAEITCDNGHYKNLLFELPCNWSWATLFEVTEFIRNGAQIKQIKGAAGIPITRIETISDSELNLSRMGYSDIFDENEYSNYYLQEGDILMSHINSRIHVGKCALCRNIPYKIIHGMNLLRICLKKEILPEYITLFFRTNIFYIQIDPYIKNAVNQASINITNLQKTLIPIPPLPEQKRIVDGVNKTFAKLDAIMEDL